MKSSELNHLLRAADQVTGQSHEFLLVGSQAILAHIDPEWFPEIPENSALFTSREIDIAALDGECSEQETIATQIDGSLGPLSTFDTEFGYYADGVEIQTVILASGWKERLIPYQADGIRPNAFWALSYQDLLVSKLMAGREKDLDFVRAMHKAQPTHPGLQDVEQLIQSIDSKYDPIKPIAISRWRFISSSQSPKTPTQPKP